MKNYNIIGKKFGRLLVTGIDVERTNSTNREYVKCT